MRFRDHYNFDGKYCFLANRFENITTERIFNMKLLICLSIFAEIGRWKSGIIVLICPDSVLFPN